MFGIVALLLIALVVMTAGPALAAYSVKQVILRVSGVAGETLTTGQAVCFKDADGYVYKADANDSALRPAIGVVGSKTGTSGETVEIIIIGTLTGWSSLSENGEAYLSETAGALTQSAPSYSQQIGAAISETDYLINCKSYFDSSAVTALGVLSGAAPIVLEGATANDYETTVGVTDPTADRTITLPDASGCPILASAIPGAANSVSGAANGFVFEGTTADDYEMTFSITDPTADRTVTFPDKTGQVQLASAASALTPAAAVTLTVGLSNLYTDLVTDNEDQTITFSGAGTAGDEITIVFTTAGSADEVITFHATLVSSTGTLTLGTDAGKYYVIRFISNGTHWYEICRTAVQT